MKRSNLTKVPTGGYTLPVANMTNQEYVSKITP